jgi:hypothetical protein
MTKSLKENSGLTDTSAGMPENEYIEVLKHLGFEKVENFETRGFGDSEVFAVYRRKDCILTYDTYSNKQGEHAISEAEVGFPYLKEGLQQSASELSENSVIIYNAAWNLIHMMKDLKENRPVSGYVSELKSMFLTEQDYQHHKKQKEANNDINAYTPQVLAFHRCEKVSSYIRHIFEPNSIPSPLGKHKPQL